MSRLSSHPRYRFLKWSAYWKVFNYTHSHAFWWPWVPIMLASALLMKAVSDIAIADYLIWLSLIMYFCEQPLILALSRRTYHQTIRAIGISSMDIHHVNEGLKLANFDYAITDDMTYGDFIVCDLIGQLART